MQSKEKSNLGSSAEIVIRAFVPSQHSSTELFAPGLHDSTESCLFAFHWLQEGHAFQVEMVTCSCHLTGCPTGQSAPLNHESTSGCRRTHVMTSNVGLQSSHALHARLNPVRESVTNARKPVQCTGHAFHARLNPVGASVTNTRKPVQCTGFEHPPSWGWFWLQSQAGFWVWIQG